jgi:fructose-bisphosphate aldolase, class I
MVKLDKLLRNGKALFLAYDQGLEHGPTDFNDKNVDPNYIIDIAKKGGFNAVIFQKGIAEKYNKEIKESKVPLIVKLNGKTNLVSGDPVSRQLCTVDEALSLGAVAVGYTLYIGSMHENVMFSEFEGIVREAHKKNISVIAWIYPRGKGTEGKTKRELLAYATRTGLELDADIIKIHWDSDVSDLKWAVKSAGKAKVVVAGGAKEDEDELLLQVKEIIKAGCIGLAIGRNVWQSDEPVAIANRIKKVIWG